MLAKYLALIIQSWISCGFIGVNQLKSFWEADQYCIDTYSAHLASVHSNADNQDIYNICNNLGASPGTGCYIGFTDTASEGTWVWVDGSPVVYTAWSPGEPNNYGDQDFAYIWAAGDPHGRDGRWDDGGGGGGSGGGYFICNDANTIPTINPTATPTSSPTC